MKLGGRPNVDGLQALAADRLAAAENPFKLWFFLSAFLCIALVAANILTLSVFFEDVFGAFGLAPEAVEALGYYVVARSVLFFLATALYFLAYFKRRFFVALSAGCVLLMAFNLVNDWILVYAQMRAEALPLAFVMTALRFLSMALLIVNVRLYALGRV
jgi:hypothetical protein